MKFRNSYFKDRRVQISHPNLNLCEDCFILLKRKGPGMDDRDKGPDIFDRIFSGFFESGFDRHFNEMSRQMEEMFKNMGDINITVGTIPPGVIGNHGSRPPMGGDPRDQMLKDSEPTTNNPVANKSEPQVETGNNPNTRRPFFPSIFENRDFKSPFPDRVPTVPPNPDCGCEGSNTGESSSPWQSSSSSSTSFNMGFGSGSWSGQSIRTIRHPDGSVEEIVKKTENGRTCTTVTKTDSHGVTTSTTTCDRPAIDGSPQLNDSPKPLPPPPGMAGSPGAQGTGSDRGKMTKEEEASFFKKYLGFDLFKPKS